MDWSSCERWLSLIGNGTCLPVPIILIICGDLSTGTQSLFEVTPIWDMAILLSVTAFRETGYGEFHFKINHQYQLLVIGAGKKGMEGYDTSHLHVIMFPLSLSLSFSHTCAHTRTPTCARTHTVHTFYILDFSFLKFPLRLVCCYLISLPLFYGKAHRGAGSMAPLAWSGSSSLSWQQNHLSQDQAVDTQLHLLTVDLCHVRGSGKGFLCEGQCREWLLSHYLIACGW